MKTLWIAGLLVCSAAAVSEVSDVLARGTYADRELSRDASTAANATVEVLRVPQAARGSGSCDAQASTQGEAAIDPAAKNSVPRLDAPLFAPQAARKIWI